MNPREQEHGECREDRADKGAARHTERDRRRADKDRERCADGCARGDAEDERLCERVLYARLHDDTCERKSRSCGHREQDARHAQRPDNIRHGGIGSGRAPHELGHNNVDRIVERHGNTARRDGADSDESKQKGERQWGAKQIFGAQGDVLSCFWSDNKLNENEIYP